MNQQRIIIFRQGILITMLFLLFAGCKQSTPVVASNVLKGKVTLDGELVKIGIVRAIGEDQKSADGMIGPNGTYVVSNPPIGKVVLVVLPPPGLRGMPKGRPKGNGEPDDPVLPKDAPKHPVPDRKLPEELTERLKSLEKMPSKYSLPDQSGLDATVVEGITEYDIKLSTK